MEASFADSMYYTFSTISQVLAAFISLSGVFLIFKIQELKKMQLQHVHNFINQLDTQRKHLAYNETYKCIDIAKDLVNLHRAECLDGMLNQMKLLIDSPAIKKLEVIKDLERIHKIYPKMDCKRVRIVGLAKISLVIGGIAILYSIYVLNRVPDWCNYFKLLFIIGLLLTIASIGIMIVTIFMALTDLKSDHILLES